MEGSRPPPPRSKYDFPFELPNTTLGTPRFKAVLRVSSCIVAFYAVLGLIHKTIVEPYDQRTLFFPKEEVVRENVRRRYESKEVMRWMSTNALPSTSDLTQVTNPPTVVIDDGVRFHPIPYPDGGISNEKI